MINNNFTHAYFPALGESRKKEKKSGKHEIFAIDENTGLLEAITDLEFRCFPYRKKKYEKLLSSASLCMSPQTATFGAVVLPDSRIRESSMSGQTKPRLKKSSDSRRYRIWIPRSAGTGKENDSGKIRKKKERKKERTIY